MDIDGNVIELPVMSQKLKSDGVIYELTTYDQNKSVRARAMKKMATSDLRRSGVQYYNFFLTLE